MSEFIIVHISWTRHRAHTIRVWCEIILCLVITRVLTTYRSSLGALTDEQTGEWTEDEASAVEELSLLFFFFVVISWRIVFCPIALWSGSWWCFGLSPCDTVSSAIHTSKRINPPRWRDPICGMGGWTCGGTLHVSRRTIIIVDVLTRGQVADDRHQMMGPLSDLWLTSIELECLNNHHYCVDPMDNGISDRNIFLSRFNFRVLRGPAFRQINCHCPFVAEFFFSDHYTIASASPGKQSSKPGPTTVDSLVIAAERDYIECETMSLGLVSSETSG